MRKSTRIWLITAAALIAAGTVILTGVMIFCNRDFKKLGTEKYETKICEITETFKDLSLKNNTADVFLVPTNSEKCTVEFYQSKNHQYTAVVENETLVIIESADSTEEWYGYYINIDFDNPKITVYLPQTEYNSLLIKGSTGNIDIPKNFKFENINISVSTGNVTCSASATDTAKIELSTGNMNLENATAKVFDLKTSTGNTDIYNVNCENLISKGTTGDITLRNVICIEKFSAERSTGDVTFNGCECGELFIKTTTGDVNGKLLTAKNFNVKTNTGSVSVPQNNSGGKAEITTTTGDIIIKTD